MRHTIQVLTLLCCLPLFSGCLSSGPEQPSGAEKQRLVEIHTDSAQQYLNMGDLDRAEGQVEKGLDLDPENTKLRVILGKTLLKRGGANDLLRSEKVFRSLLDQGDFQVSVGLGATLERLAVLHRESAAGIRSGKHVTQASDPEVRAKEFEERARQQLLEARTFYERSLKEKPENIDGITGMVRACALLGDDAASVEHAETLVRLLREDRKFWEVSLLRPEISADEELRFRKLARAQAEIEIATRLHAATLLHKLGREAQAIGHLDNVIELKPELAEAYSRRAEGRMALGMYREAELDLDSFLRLVSAGKKSDDPDVRRAYRLMDECRRKGRESAPATAGE